MSLSSNGLKFLRLSSPTSSSPSQQSSSKNTGGPFTGLPKLEFPKFLESQPFPQLQGPQAPTFPTFNELVSQPTLSEPPQQQGLFSSLVRDPGVLYQAYLDEPEHFDGETASLLVSLVSGQKSLSELTADEMKKLDEATIEFAQAKPRTKELEVKPVKAVVEEDEDDEDGDLSWDDFKMGLKDLNPPSDMPTVPSKWWDRG